MNRIISSIKSRLSLRQPQSESLRILAELCDQISLKKERNLEAELQKVHSFYPTCSDLSEIFRQCALHWQRESAKQD